MRIFSCLATYHTPECDGRDAAWRVRLAEKKKTLSPRARRCGGVYRREVLPALSAAAGSGGRGLRRLSLPVFSPSLPLALLLLLVSLCIVLCPPLSSASALVT